MSEFCKPCQRYISLEDDRANLEYHIFLYERAVFELSELKKSCTALKKEVAFHQRTVAFQNARYKRLEAFAKSESDKLYLSKLFACVQWGDCRDEQET